MSQLDAEPSFEHLVGTEVVQHIEQDAVTVRKTVELDLLIKAKFAAPTYGLLKNVGDGTGARNYRWADWLAMSLWPSRGLTLIGIECKVSRADWLKELKTPDKAEAIAQYCDEWYLAVGDKGIVKEGELPPNWGLLVPTKGGLRVSKPAVALSPVPVDRSFLAAIFRRCAEQQVSAAELKQAADEGYAKGAKSNQWEIKNATESYAKLSEKLKAFEAAAGITLDGFEYGWKSPEKFGAAFKMAMEPQDENAKQVLRRVIRDAKDSVKNLEQLMQHLAWVNE